MGSWVNWNVQVFGLITIFNEVYSLEWRTCWLFYCILSGFRLDWFLYIWLNWWIFPYCCWIRKMWWSELYHCICSLITFWWKFFSLQTSIFNFPITSKTCIIKLYCWWILLNTIIYSNTFESKITQYILM